LASVLVVGSMVTDTSGTAGFWARTLQPKLSNSEKLPTSAKSLATALWVSVWFCGPLNASSYESSVSLRP